MKKRNIDDIETIYKKFNLTMLSDFVNIDTNIECIDEEGYKYFITPYNLAIRKNTNIKTGRFNSKNIFKEYNMYHYMDINIHNGTKILFIPEKIDTQEVVFNCGDCHKDFKQLWKIFINNNPNKCCQECSFLLKKSKKKPMSYIKKIFEDNGFNFIDDPQSFGMHHAYYVEDENGYKGRMLPYTSLKHEAKIERFHSKNKYSIENINLYCIQNSMNIRCVSDTFGTYTPLEFICSCGEHFFALWDNVIKGKYRCNKCSKAISNNEFTVLEYLNKNNIQYIKQYNIGKYKQYKRLFFDFYLPAQKAFIEVDGEQHFRPVKFGGMSLEQATKNFILQKERDEAKKQFCLENNYKLIRIDYTQISDKSYEKIIRSIFDGIE